MKNKPMILMALTLAVATAVTAATAFAHPKKKQIVIVDKVADSIHAASQATLRLKVRGLRAPVTFTPSKKN